MWGGGGGGGGAGFLLQIHVDSLFSGGWVINLCLWHTGGWWNEC